MLSPSQSFRIPLARREESFSISKAPHHPPSTPPSQGGERDRSLATSFHRAQQKHASRNRPSSSVNTNFSPAHGQAPSASFMHLLSGCSLSILEQIPPCVRPCPDRQTGKAMHQRLGQIGEMSHHGRPGGSCPGHASRIGTEGSHWQGCSVTPNSHLAQAQVPGQSLLAVFFGYRFVVKTRKFMPAGLLAIVSVAVLAVAMLVLI